MRWHTEFLFDRSKRRLVFNGKLTTGCDEAANPLLFDIVLRWPREFGLARRFGLGIRRLDQIRQRVIGGEALEGLIERCLAYSESLRIRPQLLLPCCEIGSLRRDPGSVGSAIASKTAISRILPMRRIPEPLPILLRIRLKLTRNGVQ